MNLLVITRQFGNYTGATVSTIELLKRIKNNFDQVEVVTLKKDDVQIDGVNVTVFQNIFALIKKVKASGLENDYVGYSDDHLGFLFGNFHIPYLHTYHGNWPDARWLSVGNYVKSLAFIPMYKATLSRASKVVSVSQYMKKKFVSRLNSNVSVIYNGIKQDRGLLKVKQEKKLKFLMVGNVDVRKYGLALKVFSNISSSFQYDIDIYGQIIDENLRKKLIDIDFCHIMGQRKKINYVDYEALICTSKSENLPVSIVEALISGIPVITFDVGGIKEVVKTGVNGEVIPVTEIKRFADVLNTFENHYDVDSMKMLYDQFNWDFAAEKYQGLFKELEGESDERKRE